MMITISGSPGSGKSTVAEILSKRLGLKHYSTGDFMREMAQARGITLEKLGDQAKTDSSIDKELDDRQIRLGKEEDDFLIDGRLSFHFIPHSIKVFVDADIKIRAERTMKDIKTGARPTEEAHDVDEVIEKIKKREEVEQERYKQYYNLNPYNKEHYDIVVDSSNISAEQVADKIIEFAQDHQ